jgi:guanylate kinase
VKQSLPEAVAVFIVPPSRQDVEQRLRARGQDSDQAIARRLDRARQEMDRWSDYDFLVVNDDLERASDELRSIVVACRCRRRDNDERFRKILDTFGGA